MRDSFPLHCCRVKASTFENPQEPGDGCHHRHQTKILWCKQTGWNHDRDEIQDKLRKLRCSSNEPAGNRPAFQIREQMVDCKVPIRQSAGDNSPATGGIAGIEAAPMADPLAVPRFSVIINLRGPRELIPRGANVT